VGEGTPLSKASQRHRRGGARGKHPHPRRAEGGAAAAPDGEVEGGRPPAKNRSNGTTGFAPKPNTLAEHGIRKSQSSKWQRLADVPEPQFEAALAKPGVPTTRGILASRTFIRASLTANATHRRQRSARTLARAYGRSVKHGFVDAADVEAVATLLRCSGLWALQLTKDARGARQAAKSTALRDRVRTLSRVQDFTFHCARHTFRTALDRSAFRRTSRPERERRENTYAAVVENYVSGWRPCSTTPPDPPLARTTSRPTAASNATEPLQVGVFRSAFNSPAADDGSSTPRNMQGDGHPITKLTIMVSTS
jgi:hypothetical protein